MFEYLINTSLLMMNNSMVKLFFITYHQILDSYKAWYLIKQHNTVKQNGFHFLGHKNRFSFKFR